MGKNNIKNIQDAFKKPLEGLKYDLRYNDFWYEKPGEKPDNIEKSQEILLEYYKKAP